MLRVLRPGGHLAVAVWAALDDTPGYLAMTDLLQRLFGGQIADALRSPYVLGDSKVLSDLFAEAGAANVQVATHQGMARFPSVSSWIHTDIKGWTLADLIDDEQFVQLQKEAESALQQFVTADGSVAFSAPAHIVTATKR